jgi:hypothetical protein
MPKNMERQGVLKKKDAFQKKDIPYISDNITGLILPVKSSGLEGP